MGTSEIQARRASEGIAWGSSQGSSQSAKVVPSLAQSGWYSKALLERDDRRRRAKQALEDKLQEAVDDGPGEPLTRDEWDSMRQKAEEIRP